MPEAVHFVMEAVETYICFISQIVEFYIHFTSPIDFSSPVLFVSPKSVCVSRFVNVAANDVMESECLSELTHYVVVVVVVVVVVL